MRGLCGKKERVHRRVGAGSDEGPRVKNREQAWEGKRRKK